MANGSFRKLISRVSVQPRTLATDMPRVRPVCARLHESRCRMRLESRPAVRMPPSSTIPRPSVQLVMCVLRPLHLISRRRAPCYDREHDSDAGVLPILSIGSTEILIIIALTLVLFGPERLMEISRVLGRAMREVRRAIADVRQEVEDATNVDSSRDDR